VKVSVSLPAEEIEFLDAFVRERGLDSRSAALQQAVRVLRTGELGAAYEGAWEEWASSGDADLWDRTSKDGLPR
jgi:antitoxin MazE9